MPIDGAPDALTRDGAKIAGLGQLVPTLLGAANDGLGEGMLAAALEPAPDAAPRTCAEQVVNIIFIQSLERLKVSERLRKRLGWRWRLAPVLVVLLLVLALVLVLVLVLGIFSSISSTHHVGGQVCLCFHERDDLTATQIEDEYMLRL